MPFGRVVSLPLSPLLEVHLRPPTPRPLRHSPSLGTAALQNICGCIHLFKKPAPCRLCLAEVPPSPISKDCGGEAFLRSSHALFSTTAAKQASCVFVSLSKIDISEETVTIVFTHFLFRSQDGFDIFSCSLKQWNVVWYQVKGLIMSVFSRRGESAWIFIVIVALRNENPSVSLRRNRLLVRSVSAYEAVNQFVPLLHKEMGILESIAAK